ncbi:MAG: EamA family transporter [Micromonosporaceae bacterium]
MTEEVPGTNMIFALVSAILYGTADFLGGAAARRTPVLGLLLVSVPFGAAIIFAAALMAGGTQPAAADLAWGAASGVVGGLGLVVFYAGLAAGPMSVVAPVSALVATVLPVGVALAGGERPHPAVLGGVAACLAAIVLVSMDSGGPPPAGSAGLPSVGSAGPPPMGSSGPPTDGRACPPEESRRPGRAPSLPGGSGPSGLLCGLAAGAAFGLFFVLVRNAAHAGGFWPLVASRSAGTLTVVAAAAWAKQGPPRWSRDRTAMVMALLSGVFDASANVFYALAVSSGLFSIAVVLTSLYPAVTVLLARTVLGERMRRLQRAGLVLAAVGVVLVTAA